MGTAHVSHGRLVETRVSVEARISQLLSPLSIEQKIGQLQQVQGGGGHVPTDLAKAVREGRVGSVINEVHADTVNALQWIAVHESPHGIPLLIGRDVIHGFATVFPIPLGQASSWNPEAVERGARIAATEASAHSQREVALWTLREAAAGRACVGEQ